MSTAVLPPILEPMTIERNVETDSDEDIASIQNDAKSLAFDDSSIPSLADDMLLEDFEDNLSLGGLINLGNTCYLNSATQMLASLDQFWRLLETSCPTSRDVQKVKLRQEFLSLMNSLRIGETVRPDAFKQEIDERSPLFVGFHQQDAHEFLTTLLDLLDEVYKVSSFENDDAKSLTHHEETVDTDACHIPQEINPSNQTISDEQLDLSRIQSNPLNSSISRLPSFCGLNMNEITMLIHGNNEQEGEQESLSSLCFRPLDDSSAQCKLIGGRAVAMEDVEPRVQMHRNIVESSVSHELPSPEQMQEEVVNSSPIDQYFCTEVRSRLTCDSCKYTRTRIEKFLHLSIDVGSNGGTSLEEGLRKFFSPEKRELKCEKCFCESATQTSEITKLPPALLFHFKRFIVNVSPDFSTVTYCKNQSAVDFPFSLSLDVHSALRELFAEDVVVPARLTQTPSYKIRSICNHIGSSASCGHYTADAYRLYNTGERAWTRFNDAHVTRLDDAMGAETTAYMVLYEMQ